jgi:hypothetical protein
MHKQPRFCITTTTLEAYWYHIRSFSFVKFKATACCRETGRWCNYQGGGAYAASFDGLGLSGRFYLNTFIVDERKGVCSIFKTNLQNNVERLRADSVRGVVDLMVCLHYSVYTTPFTVFSVVVSFLTLFRGVCWVTFFINNFTAVVTSWHLAFECACWYLGVSNVLIVLWGACLCYTMVYKLTKVYTNDTCH